MNKLAPHERLLAGSLAALAGYVDAVGFVEMGGFFVSFMSGNSTRTAVGLAQHSLDAARAGGLIAAFVIGVAAGTLVGRLAGVRRRPAILLSVAILLGAAATLGVAQHGVAATLVMAAAMGAINAVFAEGGDVRIGVTYMTGTLVKLGQRLALAIVGEDRFGWAPYLLQWLCLVLGAIAGALAHMALGLAAVWIPAAAALAISLLVGWRRPGSAR